MSEHIPEEQLVLHYYGEGDRLIEEHLGGCVDCRTQYRRLQLVLNSVRDPLPERSPDYESRLWAKLEPKVRRSDWRRWFEWRTLVPVAAVAALVVIAFFAGRYTPRPSEVASNAPQVRERVLLVAVGQHLERSQMVLAALVNLHPKERSDIAPERAVARNLVDENRLYRQTAQAAGDARITSVLDDLERVLVEIANSPEEASAAQLDVLRQRIESEGLLFKVRVVRSRLREEVAPLKTGTTKL
jgi:hypothetical protein